MGLSVLVENSLPDLRREVGAARCWWVERGRLRLIEGDAHVQKGFRTECQTLSPALTRSRLFGVTREVEMGECSMYKAKCLLVSFTLSRQVRDQDHVSTKVACESEIVTIVCNKRSAYCLLLLLLLRLANLTSRFRFCPAVVQCQCAIR
jgi:hypothetical protein